MKLIAQLRKNAYAFEISCARVQIRSADDLEDEDEETEEDEELDEARTHQDPSGSAYCSIERSGPDVDFANPHNVDEIRAEKPPFGFC